MDIKYLHHSEIDYDKWEDCVSCSLNACVFGHAWLLDIMQSNWGAVVMDDYVAVMPVLFNGQDFVMPKYMFWTGVYSAEFLDDEVYHEFLKVIADRFRFVNIAFDKFFHIPKKTIGRVRQRVIYQYDVVRDMKDRINNSSFFVKGYIVASSKRGYTCERVMEPIGMDVFTGLEISSTFKDMDLLQRIVTESINRKACVQFKILDADKRTIGFLVALLVENYIFVPLLAVDKKTPPNVVQMLLIYHLMAFLDGCPGVLILSPEGTGLKPISLSLMGAKLFRYNTLRIGRLSRFLNIFKRKQYRI